MLSTLVYQSCSNQTILTAAVQGGVRKGKFSPGTGKEASSANSSILSPKTPTRPCDMGFSFWDRHKSSIITDMVIAILIVATCLIVGYGCHSPSPAIWGITGSSLFVSAVCIDAIGRKLNIIRLSNKIEEVLNANGREQKQITNNLL